MIHLSPCCCAKSRSCGVLAICPVRLSTISDSTPAAHLEAWAQHPGCGWPVSSVVKCANLWNCIACSSAGKRSDSLPPSGRLRGCCSWAIRFTLCSWCSSHAGLLREFEQGSPTGLQPARRHRSTAASVCPGLTRTPPRLALKGKMCPGLRKSSGLASGSARLCRVLHLRQHSSLRQGQLAADGQQPASACQDGRAPKARRTACTGQLASAHHSQAQPDDQAVHDTQAC